MFTIVGYSENVLELPFDFYKAKSSKYFSPSVTKKFRNSPRLKPVQTFYEKSKKLYRLH